MYSVVWLSSCIEHIHRLQHVYSETDIILPPDEEGEYLSNIGVHIIVGRVYLVQYRSLFVIDITLCWIKWSYITRSVQETSQM